MPPEERGRPEKLQQVVIEGVRSPKHAAENIQFIGTLDANGAAWTEWARARHASSAMMTT
jgi:hypothetical protein